MSSSAQEELAETKARLGEVVDEVLFLEGELSARRREVEFLKQALSDSTDAHGRAVRALAQESAQARRMLGGARQQAAVRQALDDLRGFQQGLQRLLVEAHVDLPASTFAPGRQITNNSKNADVGAVDDDIYHLTDVDNDNMRTSYERNADQASSSAGSSRRNNRRNQDEDEDDKPLRQQQDLQHHYRNQQGQQRVWDHEEVAKERARARKLAARVAELETELRRARATQVWPFKDDHRSELGAFGMSTNSDTASADAEVARLRRRLQEQQKEFDSQRQALLQQAEAELKDAEREIQILRRNSQSHGLGQSRNSPSASPSAAHHHQVISTAFSPRRASTGAASVSSRDSTPTFERKRLRVRGMRINEDGGVDFVDPHGTPASATSASRRSSAVSAAGGGNLADDDAEIMIRVRDLEKRLVLERKEKEKLKRALQQAEDSNTKTQASMDDLALVHGIGQEEMETERHQRRALQQQLEKAQRDREVTMREIRAAERRHSALIDEMKQVMEERDRAVANTDDANRKYLQGLNDLERARTDLQSAENARRNAEEDKRRAEKELSAQNRNLEAARRKVASSNQDMAILEQQKDALVMERDAAIREQENAMKRLDQALGDRKNALQSRDKALQDSSALENENARLKMRQHRDAQAVEDLQNKVDEMEKQVADATNRLEKARKAETDAKTAAERADEARINAEQEMEVAERQANALREELKSVLRVRDIALQQRDAALRDSENALEHQHVVPKALMDGDDGEADVIEQMLEAEREKSRQLWERIDELEVTVAALEDEKQSLEAAQDDAALGGVHMVRTHKTKLVSLSRQLADVHESIKLRLSTVQAAIAKDPSEAKLTSPTAAAAASKLKSASYVADGSSTVPSSIASSSQSLRDMIQVLTKQSQALADEGRKEDASIRTLLELADRAAQRADRLRAEANGLAGDNFGELERQRKVLLAQLEAEKDRTAVLEGKITRLSKHNDVDRNGQQQSGSSSAVPSVHVQELEETLEGEREQLREALNRLQQSDDKVLELKRKLRTNLFEMERLEAERDRLAAHVENASIELRGVANQKTNAAKELEEVYLSLTDLEKQLVASHAENTRLKRVLASNAPNNRRSDLASLRSSSQSGSENEHLPPSNQPSTPATSGGHLPMTELAALSVENGDEYSIHGGRDPGEDNDKDQVFQASQHNVRIKRSGSIVIE